MASNDARCLTTGARCRTTLLGMDRIRTFHVARRHAKRPDARPASFGVACGVGPSVGVSVVTQIVTQVVTQVAMKVAVVSVKRGEAA